MGVHRPLKAKYVVVYGEESWELDALEPSVIAQLIRSTVLSHRDESLWKAAVARQRSARRRLRELAESWGDA